MWPVFPSIKVLQGITTLLVRGNLRNKKIRPWRFMSSSRRQLRTDARADGLITGTGKGGGGYQTRLRRVSFSAVHGNKTKHRLAPFSFIRLLWRKRRRPDFFEKIDF